MRWRNILAFVDASDAGLARTRMAVSIAEKNSAWLDAVIIAALPEPVAGPTYTIVESGLDEVRRGVVDAARKAAETCGPIVATGKFGGVAEVRACFSRAVGGLTGCAARATDLVVLAQPADVLRNTLEKEILVGALFGGGHPCLMVPQAAAAHQFGRRIFIAWKGVPEAARAVQGALPFLVDAESVRLCTINEHGSPREDDPEGMGTLVDYLRRHGVKVEAPLALEANLPEEPNAAIFSEMDAFNADMLVMGAYHRSRWNELVFGGMTRRIIHESNIPVLFSH